MHAKALAASALLSSSLASVVTPSVPNADPTITPGPDIELFRKQNNDRYMGWVRISGVWSSQSCESGATYFQSGGHWRCCAATAAGCDVPQACVNGNLIYNGALIGESTSLTFPCTSVYPDPTDRSFTICNTAYMYQNDQDASPQTNVNCGVSSVNWSYYRVQPEAAKTTSQSSTRRSTSVETSSINNGDTNAANPTLVPTSDADSKSSSKAWIAGAVIGPIVGLALIGFLVWFCLRRKKKTSAAAAAPPYAPQPVPAPTTGPSSPAPYYPPPMQQQGPGMAPMGVTDGKQAWSPSPVSPTSHASSPNPLSMYGGQYPQQGGHAGPGHVGSEQTMPVPAYGQPQGQPVYNVPSPSMSPPPGGAYAENNAAYHQPQPQQQNFEARPFSSELDASPQTVNVQPKHN